MYCIVGCVLHCTDTKQCKQHPVYGRMGSGRSVRSWFLLILPFSRTDSRDLGPEGAPGIHFMLDVVFEINFDRSFKQHGHDLKYEAKVLPFSQNQMYCWCWRSTHKRSDLACLETFAKIVTSNHGGIRYNIQQDYKTVTCLKTTSSRGLPCVVTGGLLKLLKLGRTLGLPESRYRQPWSDTQYAPVRTYSTICM